MSFLFRIYNKFKIKPRVGSSTCGFFNEVKIMIQLNKVKKSFGGSPLFDELSLELKEGERVGIVGRNGTGKTTLFKLLSGIERPDQGDIFIKKGLKIGYLAQIPRFSDGLTVYDVLLQAFSELLKLQRQLNEWEQVMANSSSEKELSQLLDKYGLLQEEFQRLGGYEMERLINQVLFGLDIHDMKEKLFNSLSGGEQTKVSLGHLLLTQPDLLLLDEPTNHLDITTVEWLETYLKEYKGTMLIISHDRVFLDEVVTKIVELEDGLSHIFIGNYSYYVEEKERRLLAEFAAYQEQQKKIQKMKETIKRLKEWANRANPPNDGMHRRAKSMEKALDRMEKLNRPILDRRKMKLEFELDTRSGKDVVQFDEVSHSFGEDVLFEEINFLIQFKQHVAFVGRNGCGKSTLLKMITNELIPEKGTIRLGSGIKMGYLSQHVFSNTPSQTVVEAFREEVPVELGEARHILAKFLFFGESVFRKLEALSGGERMRLKLAQLMYQDLNLLVLDEPTNHLDIESREILEEAVNQFQGTVIAVSHDRYFLNQGFQLIFWLENKTLTRYEGNYSEAREKRKENTIRTSNHLIKKETETHLDKKVEHNKNIHKEPKNLEQEIEDVENNIKSIEEKMGSEDASLDDLTSLQKDLDRLENRRNDLYSKLEETQA
jgi:ATP-binding cassette, subfamily F, member 3